MQRGFSPILILVGIVLVIVMVGGVYYLRIFQSTKSITQNSEVTTILKLTPIPSKSTTDETANWKSYTNKDIGIEIKYPDNLKKTPDSANGDYAEFNIYAPSNIEYLEIKTRPIFSSSIEKEKKYDISSYVPYEAQYVGQTVLAGKEAFLYKTEKAIIPEPDGNERLIGYPYQKYIIYLTNKKKVEIGYFGTGKTKDLFEKILSTVKFKN